MSRGLSNNNPGNIRLAEYVWQGEIRPSKDKAFCQFKDMASGYRALLRLLQNYKKLHGCDTIRKMINRWAPPVENNTLAYINFVCLQTGIGSDAAVNVDDRVTMLKIAAAISQMENGVKTNMSDIEKGWALLCGSK